MQFLFLDFVALQGKTQRSISVESKTTNNQFLVDIINSWPNKYSNDDKTMVVIK